MPPFLIQARGIAVGKLSPKGMGRAEPVGQLRDCVMKPEITQSIAARKLSFGSEEMTVVIGMPQVIEDNDVLCPYAIAFGEDVRKGHAIGVDGVQAIQLAMRKIASYLLHMSKVSGVPISWEVGGRPGDTEFSAEK